jgi:hypothetical protein
MNFGLHS